MGIYLQTMDYSNIDLMRMSKILADEEFATRHKNINNQVMESVCSYFIKKNDEDIGYIFLMKEKYSDILFVDIGIIEEYRYRGYGKQALNELRLKIMSQLSFYGEEKNLKLPIFAQIENKNEVAARMFSNYAVEIYSDMKTRNFIFPKEKKEEFDYLEPKEKNKILSYIKGE